MSRRIDRFLPAGIGLATFLVVLGLPVLNPRNLGWLTFGDSPTQQLGWEFFRQQQWTWPLGLTPAYGMELGGSVVYSDSIPLIAIPSKFLAPLLPEPFQYFGIWLLVCLLLQSFFAWKLLSLFTGSRTALVIGSTFLTTAPVLLWRMSPAISQWSLGGQFTLLAALWLTLRPQMHRHGATWTALLAVTTAIHAYLLVMVGTFWLADVVQRRGKFPNVSARQRHLLLPPIAVLGMAWVCGYFSVDKGAGGAGYGVFKASPWAFLDPGNAAVGTWSRILPDLPGDWIQNESFNFLGLGVIVLLCCALVRRHTYVLLARAIRKWPWSATGVLALALFSLSHEWGGHFRFIRLPVPDAALEVASVFRASGRMLWPAVYVVCVAAIVLVLRTYAGRSAIIIVALALGTQLVDTSAGWERTRTIFGTFSMRPYIESLTGEFWDRAAQRYRNVRALPLEIHPMGWERMARFAVEHRMQTDVVYLARINATRAEARQVELSKYVARGCYPRDSLFLVQPSALADVRKSLDASRDLLTEVDGLLVLAPGWFDDGACDAPN